LSGAERYVDSVTLFGADQQRELLAPSAATIDPALWQTAASRVDTAGTRWLSALQRFDLDRYLPLDILTKVDRMTMAHSIEARPALLDHTLVEFAARVPERLRMQGGVTKHLFKKAMRGLLPDAIIDRPKHGFAVPLTRWFRGGEWAAFAGDVLLSPTCRDRGIFNQRYVEKLLRLHDRGRDLDLHLWTLISFEQWCRMFVDGSPTHVRARAATSAPFVQPALAC
jgi:asparagine synthase (glutamine-hydrolysing)